LYPSRPAARFQIFGQIRERDANVLRTHVAAGGDIADGSDFADRNSVHPPDLRDGRPLHRFEAGAEEPGAKFAGGVGPGAGVDGAAAGDVETITGRRCADKSRGPNRRQRRRIEVSAEFGVGDGAKVWLFRQLETDIAEDLAIGQNDVADADARAGISACDTDVEKK
jgi:hypothetical protein